VGYNINGAPHRTAFIRLLVSGGPASWRNVGEDKDVAGFQTE